MRHKAYQKRLGEGWRWKYMTGRFPVASAGCEGESIQLDDYLIDKSKTLVLFLLSFVVRLECLQICMCAWRWCSCLLDQDLELRVVVGCLKGAEFRQSERHCAEWEAQNGVGAIQKEDISLELVTMGRGWAPFQLAWRLYQGMYVTEGQGGAVHCAPPPFASKSERPRDVIGLMECVVVFLLHHGMCFRSHRWWWPHFTSLCVVCVLPICEITWVLQRMEPPN